MKKEFCICFPSNNFQSADRYILSVKSLEHIKCVLGIFNIKFSICAQGPDWETKYKYIEKRLFDNGFSSVITFHTQEYPCKIFKLRDTAFKQSSESDFYLMVDDNSEFSKFKVGFCSGEFYLECLDFLEKNMNFAAVLCAGTFGMAHQGRSVRRVNDISSCWTDRGIVLRNFNKGNLYPIETTEFVGGLEDTLLMHHINNIGLFIAKKFYDPTRHHDIKVVYDCRGDEFTPECDKARLHETSLIKLNALKWISENSNICLEQKNIESLVTKKRIIVDGTEYSSVASAFLCLGLPVKQSKKLNLGIKNKLCFFGFSFELINR